MNHRIRAGIVEDLGYYINIAVRMYFDTTNLQRPLRYLMLEIWVIDAYEGL